MNYGQSNRLQLTMRLIYRSLFRQILVFCCLSALAAYADEKPSFTEGPRITQNPNPAAPLAALVTFKLEGTTEKTTVSVSKGERTWSYNYPPDRDPAKGLPVIGFHPGERHQIRVTVTGVNGKQLRSAPLIFDAPELPTAPESFPKINLATSDLSRAEPGYRLFNPRRRIPRESQEGNEAERRFGESFGMLLMVDGSGSPVWYYQTDSRIAGFEYDESCGHILYVTADYRVVEIDLLGNEIRSWFAARRPQGIPKTGVSVNALTFHHDADLLTDGNLLALSTERKRVRNYYTSEWNPSAVRKDQWVMGDRVVEVSPEGKVLWDWSSFEHMPVERIGYETFSHYWKRRGFPDTVDWSHANEVTKLEDGSVMVNFRYQSAVVCFDPESGEILWIFGEPSGWPDELQDKLIRLEGGAQWFWHQHAPLFTSRGTLLLFDNGNYRARPFQEAAAVDETWSRAVEYEIDFKARTARQLWTSETAHDASDRVVTIAMGSATEMPKTGNILAGYGAILDPDRISEITWKNRSQFGQVTRCVEYTRTTPARIVWDLRLEPTGTNPPIGWNLFGLTAVPALRP